MIASEVLIELIFIMIVGGEILIPHKSSYYREDLGFEKFYRVSCHLKDFLVFIY